MYHEGQLVAQNVNGKKTFIHTSHEGSSTVVTNSSGAIIENTTYSPYGEVLTGGTASKLGCEGKNHFQNKSLLKKALTNLSLNLSSHPGRSGCHIIPAIGSVE